MKIAKFFENVVFNGNYILSTTSPDLIPLDSNLLDDDILNSIRVKKSKNANYKLNDTELNHDINHNLNINNTIFNIILNIFKLFQILILFKNIIYKFSIIFFIYILFQTKRT